MGKTRLNPDDYVAIGQRYAEQVVSGEIPACRWVRLACQRQLDDLKRNWQWHFNRDRANRICRFIELLPHIKGRWSSPTIKLEPHQCFRLTTIFGWVDAEGLRRFRKALIVLPRKNGKTTEAAGVGLYGLALDNEPGAEVYAGAVTRDQVTGPSGVWTIAKKLVEKCSGFRDRYGVEPLAHSVVCGDASFKPISREAGALEGFNTHFAIIDELHAHTTREVFDVIDESTGARRQPLLYIISTEGDDNAGVFAEQVNYAEQVLAGNHEDDSYFGIIYTIDPEDDWTDKRTWYKANPNLGVSVFEKDLEVRCRQAQKNAESQASFLTKRLNVRVGAGEAYFNMLAWDRICKDASLKVEDFYNATTWITIDLASKIDLAAALRTVERKGILHFFPRFYLPEDQLEAGKPNYDLYRGWAARGFLTLTPGNIIDYEFIEQDLLQDMQNFDVQSVGIDPHNATQFNTRMMAEGLPIEPIQQSVLSLSDPMKELQARIVAGRVRHNGNPILGWCMGNVVAKVDAKDNVYPRKARNENKIDGALTAIMGTKLAMLAADTSVGVRAIG